MMTEPNIDEPKLKKVIKVGPFLFYFYTDEAVKEFYEEYDHAYPIIMEGYALSLAGATEKELPGEGDTPDIKKDKTKKIAGKMAGVLEFLDTKGNEQVKKDFEDVCVQRAAFKARRRIHEKRMEEADDRIAKGGD